MFNKQKFIKYICLSICILIALFLIHNLILNTTVKDTYKSKVELEGNNIKKTFKLPPKLSIQNQVKINNGFPSSPRILQHGKNYYIMEKVDYTLKDIIYLFKLDKNKVRKLIQLFRDLDTYEYQHNDLNWKNIMWSNRKQEFMVIDWEYATPRMEKPIYIKNDLDYLRFKIEEIAGILGKKEVELGYSLMKCIYNGESNLSYLKSLVIFFKY